MTDQAAAATVESSSEGTTTVDDIVVAKIASAAAQQVRGIHGFGSQGVGGAVSSALGAMTDAVGGTSSGPSTQGVTVQVGQHEAIISLNIVVDYGARIPQLVDALRKNIDEQINTMTGLTVKAVNVEVSDIYFPQQASSSGRTATPTSPAVGG